MVSQDRVDGFLRIGMIGFLGYGSLVSQDTDISFFHRIGMVVAHSLHVALAKGGFGFGLLDF